jgi:DNA adenine methylase
VNLFRVIREQGADLAAALEATPWARAEFEACAAPAEEPVERARRLLVRVWQGFGATRRDSTGWRQDGPIGGVKHVGVASTWRRVPDRVIAAVDRLRDAQIECRPALEVIRRYKSPDVLIYADPPYLGDSRDSSGDEIYGHEMKGETEHVELLDAILAHPGPVVLSGYASPLYDERLSGWRRLTAPERDARGKHRTEVLWVNRDAERQPSLFGGGQ